MSIHAVAQHDVKKHIQSIGEDVLLNGTHALKAVITRNAEEKPNQGYAGMLTEKAHEVAFAYLDFAINPKPIRGDTVHFDGADHEVLYVVPTDFIQVVVYTS